MDHESMKEPEDRLLFHLTRASTFVFADDVIANGIEKKEAYVDCKGWHCELVVMSNS